MDPTKAVKYVSHTHSAAGLSVYRLLVDNAGTTRSSNVTTIPLIFIEIQKPHIQHMQLILQNHWKLMRLTTYTLHVPECSK